MATVQEVYTKLPIWRLQGRLDPSGGGSFFIPEKNTSQMKYLPNSGNQENWRKRPKFSKNWTKIQ